MAEQEGVVEPYPLRLEPGDLAVFEFPGALSRDEADRIVRQFEESTGHNRHQMLVLDSGLTIDRLNFCTMTWPG